MTQRSSGQYKQFRIRRLLPGTSLLPLIALSFFAACTSKYTLTSFYVTNSSSKTMNFTASIIKYNSMGQFEMTLPFTVLPGDSVLARKAKFINGMAPNKWFTRFIIFPVDSILLNNPNDPGNWILHQDARGRPVYYFNLTK